METTNWKATDAIQVKARIDDALRRFTLPVESVSFAALHDKLRTLSSFEDIIVRYLDEEGDLITMTNDDDLHLALQIIAGTPLLRLTVIQGRPSPTVTPSPTLTRAGFHAQHRDEIKRLRREFRESDRSEGARAELQAKMLKLRHEANQQQLSKGANPAAEAEPKHPEAQQEADDKHIRFHQQVAALKNQMREQVHALRQGFDGSTASWEARREFWNQIREVKMEFMHAKKALKEEYFSSEAERVSSSDSDDSEARYFDHPHCRGRRGAKRGGFWSKFLQPHDKSDSPTLQDDDGHGRGCGRWRRGGPHPRHGPFHHHDDQGTCEIRRGRYEEHHDEGHEHAHEHAHGDTFGRWRRDHRDHHDHHDHDGHGDAGCRWRRGGHLPRGAFWGRHGRPEASASDAAPSSAPPEAPAAMRDRKMMVKAARHDFAAAKGALRRSSATMTPSEMKAARVNVMRLKIELLRTQLQATEQTMNELVTSD